MDIRNPQAREGRPDFDAHKTLDRKDARQAVKTGHIRYVLGISLALCVVAFVVFYFVYM